MFPDCARFVADHWEQRPVVLRDPGFGLCDHQQVFSALQNARAMARAGAIRDPRDVSFHEGDAVVVDPAPFLPLDVETSLAEYLARLSTTVAKEFTLLVNNFQQFSLPLARAMRQFMRNLFQQLGRMPAGVVTSHLMVSRYGVSPFAVHKDPNSVFTFLVSGRKTLRVWPFEALAERTQQPFAEHRQLRLYDFDYRPFSASGIPLDGEPGNILYWPSSFWHVGEADAEQVHVSLHLTCDLHAEPRGEVVDLLQQYAESTRSATDWQDSYDLPSRVDSGPLQPPAQITRALVSLKQALETTIDVQLKAMWLGRMSAQGFATMPRPLAHRVVDVRTAQLSVDGDFPVFWDVADGYVTLAAHGQVVRFAVRPWTEQLLAALSSRGRFTVRDITSPDALDEACGVVNHLLRINALQAWEANG